MSYCDIHRLGNHIRVIEGRELILNKQGDVAQIVLHCRDEILTIIDSGVYPEDRQAILKAAAELGKFSKVVLINSHGHADHVGNNDVIHELQAKEVEHYCPAKDYPNLCDQAGFFQKLMEESCGFLDMGPPAQAVARLMALFPELRTNKDRVGLLEDHFPLEAHQIAGISFRGFRIHNVLVIPTEGHTVGHICCLFPEDSFFYGADEFIGAVPPWGDSDPENQLAACRLVIDLIQSRVVTHAARGHHWGIVEGAAFAKALNSIIETTEQWNRHVSELLASGPQSVSSLLTAMRKRMPESFGPNANPLFDTMKVINTCHRLGAQTKGTAPDTLFYSSK